MAKRNPGLGLTDAEIAAAFSDPRWAEAFPPVLNLNQAAELAQVPKGTIYAWSSQGLLKSCAARAGRHLRVWRDRFIETIFNEGLTRD